MNTYFLQLQKYEYEMKNSCKPSKLTFKWEEFKFFMKNL